uniref:GspH/FimT family pseudopilin n=1 Tax=uncultured Halomonas sp. TaxID=173971 RepID=UPI00261EC024|nr:GspH/FimT family pseudopilin [uncultured Halomonas sp.]
MRPASTPSDSRHHEHLGFTLIELVVAIAVLAILVTWAVPGFQQFSARNEVVAEVMRLKSALSMARSAAITRRRTITLCPSVDMHQCQIRNNADGQAWLATLAIFEDTGESEYTLLHTLGESRLPTLTYRNDNRPVRYDALGRSGGYNGTFRLCGRLTSGAKVIVNNTGRVRVESGRPGC